jgi:hypothetical protein
MASKVGVPRWNDGHTDLVSESRKDRRRKARTAERGREEELAQTLDQPRLTPFDAPASGRIVDPEKPDSR